MPTNYRRQTEMQMMKSDANPHPVSGVAATGEVPGFLKTTQAVTDPDYIVYLRGIRSELRDLNLTLRELGANMLSKSARYKRAPGEEKDRGGAQPIEPI